MSPHPELVPAELVAEWDAAKVLGYLAGVLELLEERLRREHAGELERLERRVRDLERRVDTVHSRALVALTNQHGRGRNHR